MEELKRKSNPIAKTLRTRRFRPKVVSSKKIYNRKKDKKITQNIRFIEASESVFV